MNSNQYAQLKSKNGKELLFQGTRAQGELRGLIFNMLLTQTYVNIYDCDVEVVYTFPLPWGAVLLNIEVTLGDKKLNGLVVEKKQAESKYEEALSTGDTAIMLEKNADHSYSLSLGNLRPGETCSICIQYAQTLQFEQNGLRLLIPTVIAPRYNSQQNQRPTGGGLFAKFLPKHSLTADYSFSLNLQLHGDLAKARVLSTSHQLSHHLKESILNLSINNNASLDRDFVLVIDELPNNSFAVGGDDLLSPENTAVVASFCPQFTTMMTRRVSVNILVDCSGSMSGDSIAAARKALGSIVSQFNEGDRYSLSKFGSTVEHRSRAMWKAGKISKLSADRWVSSLDAEMGGTEMEAALLSTFDLAGKIESDVLLVTDGAISDIDSVIEAAKSSGHRLFIVGIGSSPAESHLRRLALATGGVCDFVCAGEAVEPAVLRMFARLRSPQLTDISVVWPDGISPVWQTAASSPIFDGDTLNVFALLSNYGTGVLKLLGRYQRDSELVEIASTSLPNDRISDTSVSRLAAHHYFNELSSQKQLLKEREKLALDYQLVTDRTNFLLIHERAMEDKSVDMPILHQVEHMIPAGFQGLGQIRYSLSSPVNTDNFNVSEPLFSRRSANSLQQIKPAVWRHCADSLHVNEKNNTDSYDIPAFLRKDGNHQDHFDIAVSASNKEMQMSGFMDKSNTLFWYKQDGQFNLTPLGLVARLRSTQKQAWPTTFKQLWDFGVSQDLADWLKFEILEDAKNVSEAMLVRCFLFVMIQNKVLQKLEQQAKNSSLIGKAFDYLRQTVSENLDKPTEEGLDEAIVIKLEGQLLNIEASHWPDWASVLTD